MVGDIAAAAFEKDPARDCGQTVPLDCDPGRPHSNPSDLFSGEEILEEGPHN